MEEIVQISTDKNVIELIELLKKNQMEREAANVVDLVSYIDVLQEKLESMDKQLNEMRKEVRHVRETQDNTLEARMNRAEAALEDGLNRLGSYMIEQTQHRIDSLRKSLQATKKFIRDKAKEIVSDFREKGKKALYKVSELLRVRHVLSGMRNSVEIGIMETNDIIARIDDFGRDMREAKQTIREAKDEKKNALRTLFGKETKDSKVVVIDVSEVMSEAKADKTDHKKLSKIELAKKPWRWQRGVYESIKLFLDTSIDKLNNLEMAVRESMSKEPDFEMDERIFNDEDQRLIPVVAEPEHKYGADAFEDYMKSEDTKIPEVETIEPKPPKR